MANKGGNIVLMDTDLEMCHIILDNSSWYKKIECEFVAKSKEIFFAFVDRAFNLGVITKHLWELVRTANPVIATFYSLPKIHKNSTHPPGCPGRGSLTQKLSEVVDMYLRPHAHGFMSYIQDSIQFLRVIEQIHIPKGALLIKIDL